MKARSLNLLLLLVGVIVINFFSASYFHRWDLTEEKRYSISDAAISLARSIPEEIEFEIYLAGDLPSGMKRLQQSTIEMLEQFKAYANVRVSYYFVDPVTIVNEDYKIEFMRELAQMGVRPTNLMINEDGKRSSKLIFPGLGIKMGDQMVGVQLLKNQGNSPASPEEILNQSIENIEYQIASSLKVLVGEERPRIGLSIGHGELDSLDVLGLTDVLLTKYDVFKFDLSKLQDLSVFDAIIINKPKSEFSELEKFKLDQYLLSGGNVLFFLDVMRVDMAEAGAPEGAIGLPFEVNLDDMLFKYGVRINRDFVQDLRSGYYPVVAGDYGDQPQISRLPWPFYVVANNLEQHPITKNLDAVYFRFVSSMDTVKAEGVLKTPLVFTSNYSRVLPTPARVAFNDYIEEPDFATFGREYLPLAYLLEGEFTSLFNNRFLPDGANTNDRRDKGVGKALVVSDGDFLRNDISLEDKTPFPLGEDPFSGSFANADFIQKYASLHAR